MNTACRHRRPRIILVITILVVVCVAILLGLYLFEVIPRHITFGMPPPADSYNRVGWARTTTSVVVEPSYLDIPSPRVFLWRRDATLVYEEGDSIPSWDALVEYFARQFLEEGWRQSDTSVPCNIYLPEASFLPYGENGFVTYHRPNDLVLGDEVPLGDAICLAIWRGQTQSNVFSVVLLTMRHSPLTNLYRIFD